MAENLGEAVLKVSADTTALDAGLARAREQAERTGTATEQAFTDAGLAVKGFAASLASLAGVVSLGVLAQQIGATGKESERSKIQIQALAGAYGEAEKAAASTARIQKILGISSLEARQSFAQLYAALRGTGIGVNELEVLFVGLSKAARLSGASTAEASGALLQLRQGLSAGVLQGDELRSVLENLPVFAQAVAKEMGVNVGQLRKLGSEGKITSDIVFNAAKRLATAAVPGKASAEELDRAFTNLKETAAEAFGPATVGVIRTTATSLEALAEVVKRNQKPLSDLGQAVVGTSRILIPLAVGIGAVNVALSIWALRAKAAAQAQILLQALSGPKGWALLALGVGAAAAASKALDAGFAGVTDTLKKANQEAAGASKEFKKVADEANLKGSGGAALKTQQDRLAIELKLNQAALQYRSLIDQRNAAEAKPRLSELRQTQLDNELRLNEKLRDIESSRLQLRVELAKSSATGQADDPQKRQAVVALQQKIKTGEIELATIRIQNAQAEANARSNEEDRIRQIVEQRAAADQRLGLTIKQTALERQALDTGIEASRTAQTRLQIEDSIATVLRQQRAAQEALASERARPAGEQSFTRMLDLVGKVETANQNVRQAYADAGRSLVGNAKSAADALRGAQESIQSTLRGGFDLLTKPLQEEQLQRARAAIQPLVDRGVIRTGLDVSTPEQLFRVASFAESFTKANDVLGQALQENAAATQALSRKDWNVYVTVPGQATALPVPRT